MAISSIWSKDIPAGLSFCTDRGLTGFCNKKIVLIMQLKSVNLMSMMMSMSNKMSNELRSFTKKSKLKMLR